VLERPGKLRAAIVDDEPLARSTLRRLIAADGEVELVAECADGSEAVRVLARVEPDLLFLDVQMPGLDGFEVLEQLGARRPPLVVFATAYDRHAIRAFELHAIDYLLKPFDDQRFAEALAAAKRRFELEQAAELSQRIAAVIADARNGQRGPSERFPARLAVHREGAVELIDVGDIEWIEAADQYVIVHTARTEHLMRESLASLETQLDPARFLRVHRSAIVALASVCKLERQGSGVGRALVGRDTWLPVSRANLARLAERLG
jgi:two-component system LytT family response regulator